LVAQGIWPTMDVEQVFKALADTNRLRIVNLLLHGELCVCDIQYVLENSQPNISRHLAYLKNSGMVVDRRDGYRVFYRIANARESNRKLLFDFLRQIFKEEEQFEQDTGRLKEAIASGSCTISEWRPYSAIDRGRLQRTGKQ
jgi:ArsR family transcriptional regulator, arsenate/arsenite/antimonite-responsive transcriptional repressor